MTHEQLRQRIKQLNGLKERDTAQFVAQGRRQTEVERRLWAMDMSREDQSRIRYVGTV